MLKIDRCERCGDNDWQLVTQTFGCKSCPQTLIFKKEEEGEPLSSRFTSRDYIDGSEDEKVALAEERQRERDKFRSKPPNCS